MWYNLPTGWDSTQNIATWCNNKYDCVIIAGDNVYPPPTEKKKKTGIDHVKKKKNYSPALVEEGFKLLADSVKGIKSSSKEDDVAAVHMILGNHNTDLLSTERSSAKNNNIKLHARMPDSPIGVHSYQDYGNVRFLFIDTNFDLRDPQTDEMMTARNVEKLQSFLDDSLRKDDEDDKIWWNIVVGHEPLVSLKTKSDGENKVVCLACAQELLKNTFANHHNVVYMCADVHMFQAGQVSIAEARVPMIVSGTGGADPDAFIGDVPSTHTPEKQPKGGALTYQLIDQASPYGYCTVRVTRKAVKVVYKPIDGERDEHVVRIKKPKLLIDDQKRRQKKTGNFRA